MLISFNRTKGSGCLKPWSGLASDPSKEGTYLKSDLELVEEVKSGERESFSLLVQRHQKALLRLCVRYTHDLEQAEDIVQESFVKAYEKLTSFEGRSSFKSWLFQIAINTSKNSLRSKSENLNIEHVNISVAPRAESGLVSQDIKSLIDLEIGKLPHRQKTALILRLYEDLGFREIAQIMDCPYDTAKANFRHGLMKIKEVFTENKMLKEWLDSNSENTTDVEHRYMEVEN